MTDELNRRSISELAPLIRDKRVSPVEVVESAIKSIREHNDQVNAFISITMEQARKAAKEAEKEIMNGEYRGALHGIPIALKDNLFVKNEVTTMGSKIHANYIPGYDATVVRKLRNSGAIFMGKVHMSEYARGSTNFNEHYGPCRNPWNHEKISGGSSGGASAAVSANMVFASIGTDTGGSVRIPSALCGTVGLKPTYGRVSKYGCFPLAWSLDHVGPITKTVKDSALLLEVIAGYDENDPDSSKEMADHYTEALSRDIENMVIGVNESYFFSDVDPDVEKFVRQGIDRLESFGAQIEHVEIPHLEEVLYAGTITSLAEASTVHFNHLREAPDMIGKEVRATFQLGEMVAAVDYLQAQRIRHKVNKKMSELFRKIDILITPTVPFVAPTIGDEDIILNNKSLDIVTHLTRFTRLFNVTGLPAITVPCGMSQGLPVGIQLVGPAFEEGRVLNVAHKLEQSHSLELKRG